MAPKSMIGQFFTRANSNVLCTICGKCLLNLNTTNLWTHLQAKHLKEYLELKKDDENQNKRSAAKDNQEFSNPEDISPTSETAENVGRMSPSKRVKTSDAINSLKPTPQLRQAVLGKQFTKLSKLDSERICSDTLAPSYLHLSSKKPGEVANKAANIKLGKYKKLLEDNYIIVPFAIETLGPWCTEAIQFVDTLGKLLVNVTNEKKSKMYLKQRISIALQRSNAACIMGTFEGDMKKLDEIYYIL